MYPGYRLQLGTLSVHFTIHQSLVQACLQTLHSIIDNLWVSALRQVRGELFHQDSARLPRIADGRRDQTRS